MSNIEIQISKEYILAADISTSMTTNDATCFNNTRYNYMMEKFKQFVKTASQYDEHGAPTIILFGQNVHTYEHCDLSKVDDLLRWKKFEGMTMIDLAIDEAFKIHRQEKREKAEKKELHKGTALMIFTDGEPSNKQGVYNSIRQVISSIDTEEEFQITFITVGKVSHEVDQFLEGLHDYFENPSINPNDFDIIHVEKLEDVEFIAAISANRHGD